MSYAKKPINYDKPKNLDKSPINLKNTESEKKFSSQNFYKELNFHPAFHPHSSMGYYVSIACEENGKASFRIEGRGATKARNFSSNLEGFGGHIRSNGNILAAGSSFIHGDATPGPDHRVIKKGNSIISGSTMPAFEELDCAIGDLNDLIEWVQNNHQNNNIPETNKGRLPWGGCEGDKGEWPFCLQEGENVNIPSGIYWFSSWNQAQNSRIILDGYVRILLTGKISLEDNAQVNAFKSPYDILVFDLSENGKELKLDNNNAFYGLIYAPYKKSHFSGNSNFQGSIISKNTKITGNAQLIRWKDNTPPSVSFIKPAANCLKDAIIEVSFLSQDNESGLDPEGFILTADNVPLEMSIEQQDAFWHEAKVSAEFISAEERNFELIASARNRAGALSQSRRTITIDRTPPVISILSPSDGAEVMNSVITVSGTAYDAFKDLCGLSVQVNDEPVLIQPDGSWTTQVQLNEGNNVISATAIDGAGNQSVVQINVILRTRILSKKLLPGGNRIDVLGNGVFEPDEVVVFQPTWANISERSISSLSGNAIEFSGPAGAIYTIVKDNALYGNIAAGKYKACSYVSGDCYALKVSAEKRPVMHWDAILREQLSTNDSYNYLLHIGKSFSDVSPTDKNYHSVEVLFHHNIITTCANDSFCPQDNLNRQDLAIWMARFLAGGEDNIPISGDVIGAGVDTYSCQAGGSSLFEDVEPTSPACKHIHFLFSASAMIACSKEPLRYCPNDGTTRADMAIFIASALNAQEGDVPIEYTDIKTGRSYSCDPSSPNIYFEDISPTDPLCAYAHYLWAKGLDEGCSAGLFCPATVISRGFMADILAKSFNLDFSPASLEINKVINSPDEVNLCDWSPYVQLFNDGSFNKDQKERLIDLYEMQGPTYNHRIKGIRTELGDNCNPSQSELNYFHNYLAELQQEAPQLDILMVLHMDCIAPARGWEAQKQYVDTIVGRFEDVVNHFEIGNQPDCYPGPIGCKKKDKNAAKTYYNDVLKPIWNYVKSKYPGEHFIPAAFQGNLDGMEQLRNFVKCDLNENPSECPGEYIINNQMGVVNIHLYCIANFDECLSEAKAAIEDLNADVELWVTETGSKTSEQSHIYYINNHYSKIGASRIYWFSFASRYNSSGAEYAMLQYQGGNLKKTDELYTSLSSQPSNKAFITANGSEGPIIINPGEQVLLQWDSSPDADSCDIKRNRIAIAHGTSGLRWEKVDSNSVFTIHCGFCQPVSDETPASDQVLVYVSGNLQADIKINQKDGFILTNESPYQVSWTSKNADSCSITKNAHGWGNGLSGLEYDMCPFFHSCIYILTCNNPTGTASDIVSVRVIECLFDFDCDFNERCTLGKCQIEQ